MDIRPGDRVGALVGKDAIKKRIYFLGYGTLREGNKIELDTGETVAGFEIIWSDETTMKRRVYNWESEGYCIKTLPIQEAREEMLRAEYA